MKDAFFPERSMTGRFITAVVMTIVAYVVVFILMAFAQEGMGISFETSGRSVVLWAISFLGNLLIYMNFHAKCHVACEKEHSRTVKENKCKEYVNAATPLIIGWLCVTLALAVVMMLLPGYIENVNAMNKGFMTVPAALVGFAVNCVLIYNKVGWPMSVVE